MVESDKHTHIAILPNPGAGHLIPLVEFVGRLLLHNPSLSFTFILIPDSSSDAISGTPSVFSTLPATAVNIIIQPPPSFPSFSNIQDEMFTRVLRSVSCSLPALQRTLQELKCKGPMAALIVDIFATDIIDVASELGIKSYVFFSSSGIALSMFLNLPMLTEMMLQDERELDKPLKFPGCPAVQLDDLPDPIQDWNAVYSKWFVAHAERFELVEGVILNSFEGLEEGPINALIAPGSGKPPVLSVGPLVRMGSRSNQSECLTWLDEQQPGSVLYVSFGSGGTLSTNQVTELAWGLELSGQRFLWVVRCPNDAVSYGTYLSLEEEKDPLGFLPKGFLERTKERGLVVLSWAPQVEILSHGSTGGFLTHCGWNSILEGVVNGVGFIAWPLYAEQRMNAIELVEDVKVALRVKKNQEGLAERTEIANVVRALMEGEEGKEIQERMKKLKDEAKRMVDKDGSSNVTLSELAFRWKAP